MADDAPPDSSPGAGNSAEDEGADPRAWRPRNPSPAGGSENADRRDLPGGEPSGAPQADDERERDERAADEADRTRQRLLAPVGSLYALAQALTDSEHAARRLVEITYARAAEALAAGQAPAPDDVRAWLFEQLVATAREQPEAETTASEKEAAASDAASDDDAVRRERHFRRRAQERFLRRALPPAFAALAPAQRLLLTLCDIEQLERPEAARVVRTSEEDARRQLARARVDLRDGLRQMAPRPERAFLEEDTFPDARLRQALRQMAKRDLTTMPPALRPAARNALRPTEGTSTPGVRREASEHREAVPSRQADDASTPAPARPPSSTDDASPRWRQRLPRLLTALLLIAGAGGIGYLTTAVLDRPAETNLAVLSARHASDVNVRLRTDSPERAEQFVRDELDRRLTVPTIQGTRLRGVGVAEIVSGERVPVFLFRDAGSGRPVTAYAYDYALLDRAGGRLRLAAGLRQQLEEEGRFVTKDVGQRRVLLWRHRDDIFAAVTDRADSLQQRIAF